MDYVIKHLSKYEITVKCIGPTTTEAEIEHWKDEVLFSPQLDELAEFLNLVGNSTRLKIVFLLTEFKELCVCDLAQILDVTVPAVSQQLAKLKAFRAAQVAPGEPDHFLFHRRHPEREAA